MKDLIAKLQMDANCALGAIWMHIDAQAARIAELEAQQAFSIGETYANALSRIAELEAQLAAKPADTDKLREAILALRVDPPRHYDNAQISAFCLGAKVMSETAAELAASTALQAPVREVPVWISISDRLPPDDCRVLVATWFDFIMEQQVEIAAFRAGSGTFSNSDVTHWMPLPAAPVQPGESK